MSKVSQISNLPVVVEDSVEVPKNEQSNSKPKNRRGRGSRAKQHDKFIDRTNVKFNEWNERRIQSHRAELGYDAAELFGPRVLASVLHPQREVVVKTEVLTEVCDLTAEVLHSACKIPASTEAPRDTAIDHDAETLRWVSSLQLESKIFHARIGTQFPVDQVVADRVRSTDLLFPHAILPVSVFLDQIGRLDIDGQTIVPHVDPQSNMTYQGLQDPDNPMRVHFSTLIEQPAPNLIPIGITSPRGTQMGMRLDHREIAITRGIIDAQGTVSPAFVANPHIVDWVGAVSFVEYPTVLRILTMTEIATRYADLVGRVDKRLATAFVDIGMTQGRGTKAQLVGRARIGESSRYEAWSTRVVDDSMLELGAILDIGGTCDMNNRGAACQEAMVETAAGITCLANILTKKIK